MVTSDASKLDKSTSNILSKNRNISSQLVNLFSHISVILFSSSIKLVSWFPSNDTLLPFSNTIDGGLLL